MISFSSRQTDQFPLGKCAKEFGSQCIVASIDGTSVCEYRAIGAYDTIQMAGNETVIYK